MTYACITVLVNLTNSYDKAEMMPEMVELAKFAKQHVPEEHEKVSESLEQSSCSPSDCLKVFEFDSPFSRPWKSLKINQS